MIETQEFSGKSGRKNGILAFHLIQSFKDFETTSEAAHKCGKKLVEKLFADKYETVIATHLDHDHLHNHIIINAVSYVDGHKYRNSYKDYFHDIREISDKICVENCLSVIDNPIKAGVSIMQSGKPNRKADLQSEGRTCDYIFTDADRIKEKYENAKRLENETNKDNKQINEQIWRQL